MIPSQNNFVFYKGSEQPFHTYFYNEEKAPVDDAIRCEICGSARTLLRVVPPWKVTLECDDRGFGDIVFGSQEGFIASERFRSLWELEKLSGIESFEPIEVLKIKRRRKFSGDPPPYFHASIVATDATIDEELSEVNWMRPPTCKECRNGIVNGWNRVIFKPETLVPFDLFHPRWPRSLTVASEHFKEFVERHGITNSRLIPCEEHVPRFYRNGNSGAVLMPIPSRPR